MSEETQQQLSGVFGIPFWTGNLDIEIELPTEFNESNIVQKTYPKLADMTMNIVQDICEQMGMVRQEVKLNDMWVNRYDKNRMHLDHHYHQNCAWTGTYFPEDSNHSLTFHNPMAGLYQGHYPKVERQTGWNMNFIQLNDCKKGYCIIHPSYLAHHVWWNGTKPSHSISFDIAYKLPIGDKDFGSYSE